MQNEDSDNLSFSGSSALETVHVPEKEPEEQKIGSGETRVVNGLRLGLVSVLLIATLVVSLFIYSYTSGAEQQNFESAYTANSAKILDTFQGAAERRLGAIASFATSVTAHALDNNAEWPFVRIPHYEAQASHVLSLADAVSLSFVVIVDPEDRPQWENEFVPRNGMAWIEESASFAGLVEDGSGRPGGPGGAPSEDEDYEGKPTVGRGGISQQIFSRRTTPLGTRGNMIADNETNLVWWHSSPMRSSGFARGFVNLNVRYDRTFEPQGRLLEVLERKNAALGLVATEGYGAREDMPITGFYYPVLTSYDEDASLAGSFITTLNWNTFFVDILPQNANGYVAVLKNTCDQAFTYMINGPDIEFLGVGDNHDPNYDFMMSEVSFTALINKAVTDGSYKGFPLDDEGCQYTLQVYASADLEAEYLSNKPAIYTLGAALIFVFTSLVFVLYDRLVEKRQRMVAKEAIKSGAIVSSLFPSAYKQQLMDEQEKHLAGKAQPKTFDADKFLKSMLNNDESAFESKAKMADLYPDCSIFFADIAGFTQWSSSRTPDDVFTLLQNIFGRFDKIARKRRVCKIETIGDCYLAVTGLPEPNDNHALAMAKFANECMSQMNEAIRSLVDKLGEDTAELALRTGLHSGPITAGILRGEKSRFQVFGDTVNTGSRMESTGEKNRIQVSPEFAALIRDKHRKPHWLQPRAELIEAKGKGAMQTYWLIPDRTKSMSGFTCSDTASSGFESNVVLSSDGGDDARSEQFALSDNGAPSETMSDHEIGTALAAMDNQVAATAAPDAEYDDDVDSQLSGNRIYC